MSGKPAQPATGHGIRVSPLVKPGQGWRRYFWKVGPSRRGDLAILVLRIRATGGKSQVRTQQGQPRPPQLGVSGFGIRKGATRLCSGMAEVPDPSLGPSALGAPGAGRSQAQSALPSRQRSTAWGRPRGAVRRVTGLSHLSTRWPEAR